MKNSARKESNLFIYKKIVMKQFSILMKMKWILSNFNLVLLISTAQQEDKITFFFHENKKKSKLKKKLEIL